MKTLKKLTSLFVKYAKKLINFLFNAKQIEVTIIWIIILISLIGMTTVDLSANERLEFGSYLETQLDDSEWIVLDLNKLAYTVAQAETGGCLRGSASRNNCFGIMTWPNGIRELKRYETKADSYADFKRIWKRYYKVYPTIREAKKWTGEDNAKDWLRIVNYYFNK